MTEIMPFPENNILFYWAAPQAGLFIFFLIFQFDALLRCAQRSLDKSQFLSAEKAPERTLRGGMYQTVAFSFTAQLRPLG